MDEFTAVQEARKFIREIGSTRIPAPVEAYVERVDGIVRLDTDLEADQPAFSFLARGRQQICINAYDRPQRRRFSICHELGHIVLKLPSDHKATPWWSYAGKP